MKIKNILLCAMLSAVFIPAQVILGMEEEEDKNLFDIDKKLKNTTSNNTTSDLDDLNSVPKFEKKGDTIPQSKSSLLSTKNVAIATGLTAVAAIGAYYFYNSMHTIRSWWSGKPTPQDPV